MAIPLPALPGEDVQQQAVSEPADAPMLDYLMDRIVAALIRSALLDTRKITVTADGSRVILAGTVRSWATRQEAERVAWSAPDVTQVENRITVRS